MLPPTAEPAAGQPPCVGIVIPFYNHEHAIEHTVDALAGHGLRCWLVDDGSAPACAPVLQRLAERHAPWLTVIRYAPNAGKGQAVMTGFAAAHAAGCSHALQIDADGQHDAGALPRFVALAREHPQAVIAGVPVYDASVPRARLYGRYLTHAMVWLNTLSLEIRDSMCGFRLYPLAPTLALWRRASIGRRMDFDTEILVRLHWDGLSVVNLPVAVRYPLDGVSHFRLLRDNARISWMHTRMFVGMLLRMPRLLRRRLRGRA